MMECDKCGACCRVGGPLLFPGGCPYLVGNECSIYEDRPWFCRGEAGPVCKFLKEIDGGAPPDRLIEWLRSQDDSNDSAQGDEGAAGVLG